MSSHLFWFSEAYDTAQMTQMRAGGIGWVRDDFDWDRIEPLPGVYDWSHTDNVMAAAAKTGMHVLGILTFSPPWASSGAATSDPRDYPPTSSRDYAAFAAAVAARYGASGSFWTSRPDLTRTPISAVELWNEPWGYWAWKPNPDPVAFAALAHAGAVAVRAVDPRIQILLPGDVDTVATGQPSTPWLGSLLEADPSLARTVDAFSAHPYPSLRSQGPYDDSQAASSSFRRVLLTNQIAAQHGVDLPVWITEIGWSTASGLPDAVSEQAQATYIQQAVVRALGDWGRVVPRIFIYSWEQSTGGATDFNGNLGLLRQDGSPKPAWATLAQLLARP